MSEFSSSDDGSDPLFKLLKPVVSAVNNLPANIKRYRIERKLGSGSFGDVFLATDSHLQRQVAIKVPRREFLNDQKKSAQYLAEAQLIAELDHPNIVPIYDVGSTFDFPCYIVTKFIDAKDLARTHAEHPFSPQDSIQLVIQVARALHFAHRRGITHRDIKPANILLDSNGKPFVADLGLAVRDSANNEMGVVGTPAYMSPEQARGEGHRVDGRSDVFSLGVILYELLSGCRPHQAGDTQELIERIANSEAKPLRQVADWLPKELERICMKSLSSRVTNRYTTAQDFADDLLDFLDTEDLESFVSSTRSSSHGGGSTRRSSRGHGGSKKTGANDNDSSVTNQAGQAKVIPKGIRAFDGHDADFYLQLLPGPLDRNGLPEIVRFWKSKIESLKPSSQCPFGFIYGPSGSGKSSLIRAGILPQLTDSITSLVIDSTRDNTLVDLKQKLIKQFPNLPADTPLDELIYGIRTHQFTPANHKLLLVFDQFEQWLSSNDQTEQTTLVGALRQCDGLNVQCIFLVRDEYWLPITRLAEQLEVQLRESENTTCVDRFSQEHAARVLHKFAHAYGRLPENFDELTTKQRTYLVQTVGNLCENDSIASVKIALAAELLREANWEKDTQPKIDGIVGLGVSYLNHCFDHSNIPTYKLHAEAARRCLQELLPSDRSNLKGPAVAESQLISAARYEQSPKLWQELRSILLNETKMISLTNSGGTETKFQMTHDYLIQSVRQWNELHQKSDPAGRAQLLLAERSDIWNDSPSTQRLPTAVETFSILRFTQATTRSPDQNRMLKAAKRLYLNRTLLIATLLGLFIAIAGFFVHGLRQSTAQQLANSRWKQASSLLESVKSTPLSELAFASQSLVPYREEATKILNKELANQPQAQDELIVRGILEQLGNRQTDYLLQRLLDASDKETSLLVDLLQDERGAAADLCNATFETSNKYPDQARLAILAMDFGNPKRLKAMLTIDRDETDRSHAIVALKRWDHHWPSLWAMLGHSEDPGTTAGLLLGLSLADLDPMPLQFRRQVISFAETKFRSDHSSAVHSAAATLLSNWKQPIPKISTSPLAAEWRISESGITMIKLDAGSVTISPTGHEKFQRKEAMLKPVDKGNFFPERLIEIKHDILMSDTEVSKELFYQFLQDDSISENERLRKWSRTQASYENAEKKNNWQTPTDDHPIHQLCMQDAILFCNWLSRKEGFQPVYSRTGDTFESRIDTGKLNSITLDVWDSWQVDYQKNGYRLPCHPEHLLARIGETDNLYSFGNDLWLAPAFANISPAAPAPIKLSFTWECRDGLPNQFGFYNLYGNVAELCHPYVFTKSETTRHEWRPKTVNQTHQFITGLSMRNRLTRTAMQQTTQTADMRTCGIRLVRRISSEEKDGFTPKQN